MQSQVLLLIGIAALMFSVIGGLTLLAHFYTLVGIKSRTVGDGQHGTARWATKQEIHKTYTHIPFAPRLWRLGKNLPQAQGLIMGSTGPKGAVTALVDTDDVHCLMIGASGVGKTAFWLYPNLEYACACSMSFLATDTKGDLFRNYGHIAKDCYGYNVAVIDLRNPSRRAHPHDTVKEMIADEFFWFHLLRRTPPPGGRGLYVPAGPGRPAGQVLACHPHHRAGAGALPQHGQARPP